MRYASTTPAFPLLHSCLSGNRATLGAVAEPLTDLTRVRRNTPFGSYFQAWRTTRSIICARANAPRRRPTHGRAARSLRPPLHRAGTNRACCWQRLDVHVPYITTDIASLSPMLSTVAALAYQQCYPQLTASSQATTSHPGATASSETPATRAYAA